MGFSALDPSAGAARSALRHRLGPVVSLPARRSRSRSAGSACAPRRRTGCWPPSTRPRRASRPPSSTPHLQTPQDLERRAGPAPRQRHARRDEPSVDVRLAAASGARRLPDARAQGCTSPAPRPIRAAASRERADAARPGSLLADHERQLAGSAAGVAHAASGADQRVRRRSPVRSAAWRAPPSGAVRREVTAGQSSALPLADARHRLPLTAWPGSTVLSQIAYPLTSGTVRDRLTVPPCCSGAPRPDARRRHSRCPLRRSAVGDQRGRRVRRRSCSGVATGVPFGSYGYAATLGPAPAAAFRSIVPLAWTMMAYPALLVGRRIGAPGDHRAHSRWRAGICSSIRRWSRPATGTSPARGPSLNGIPLSNTVGWIVVSLLIMAAAGAPSGAPARCTDAAAGDDRVPLGALSLDLRLVDAGSSGLLPPSGSGPRRRPGDGHSRRAAA